MSTETTLAELSSIAEAIDRYRFRVGDLAIPHVGSDREDLVVAIHEAERALRTAFRSLERARRLAQ